MSALIPALLLTVVPSSAGDPCDFTTQPFLDYHQVLACYRSVPFDAADRDNQVEVLGRYLEFSDLRNNYDQQVRWRAALRRVSRRHFASDFDATAALRDVVLDFQNGHFFYRGPICYSGYVFPFIPLSFGSSLRNATPLDFYERGFSRRAKQIIYVEDAPFFAADYQAATGIDASAFVGQRVVSIDGRDPIQAFRRFGRKLRFDRDAGVNLNGILEFGVFSIRTSASSPFPESPAVTFVFEDRNGRRTRKVFPWVFAQSQPRGLSPFAAPSNSEEFAAGCNRPNTSFMATEQQVATVPQAATGPWSRGPPGIVRSAARSPSLDRRQAAPTFTPIA